MHSSCASVTPPLVFAPLVFGQGLMSPKPVEVSMAPLLFLSTHCPFSTRPIWTTLLPSRLVAQTLPFWSTVVREGSFGWPLGEVEYSPMTAPVSVFILTTVPLVETATQMKFRLRVVESSCSWLAVE